MSEEEDSIDELGEEMEGIIEQIIDNTACLVQGLRINSKRAAELADDLDELAESLRTASAVLHRVAEKVAVSGAEMVRMERFPDCSHVDENDDDEDDEGDDEE